MTNPKIVSVCLSEFGGIPKYPQEKIEVNKFGIKGDFHSGKTNHHAKKINYDRQLSLVSKSVINELSEKLQVNIVPGDLGENFLVDNMGDLTNIKPGSRLKIGKEVIIEITKHNTPCVTINKIHPLLMESILGRRGLLAKVESTGTVKPGDAIEIL
ncbi:MAG: sulfurase [Chloroflexi bacterium]|nr:sulfurase [Chloroflexota bacterium]|tara:strand:- start:318 stop:785 length:468 start_codon:yes stop_codon:yes gene_type:complete